VKGRKFKRTSVHLKINKTNVMIDSNKQKEIVVKGQVQADIRKSRFGRVINKPAKYLN